MVLKALTCDEKDEYQTNVRERLRDEEKETRGVGY